ncbi:MAG: ankyrin repeat domain-containing protein [Akkermansia sp.]|nr:ankyrin repeat domain-containing protein [Akkermansia sp.]
MRLFPYLSALVMGSAMCAATAAETAPQLTQEQAVQQLSQLNITPERYTSALHHIGAHPQILQLLLAAGVNPDTPDWDGITVLQRAAECGITESVKLLLAAGANVNHRNDTDGRTALVLAIQNGHTECATLLANANGLDYQPWTPLTLGVARHDIEDIHRFIGTGNDVNEACREGYTPLQLAAMLGYTDVMQILIDAGADVDKADEFGHTPLFEAVYHGRIECVHLLLKHGANADGDANLIPLHIAAERGHAECMVALLEAGANANKTDEAHRSPLHLAVFFEHPECIDILLKHGADTTLKDANGHTATDIAEKKCSPEILQRLQSRP